MSFDYTNYKHNDHEKSNSDDSDSDEDFILSSKELKTLAMLSERDKLNEMNEKKEYSKKRRKKADQRQKRLKVNKERPEETEKETKTDPQPSENIEDIWAQFKKDCGQSMKQGKSDLEKTPRAEPSAISENEIKEKILLNKKQENCPKTKTVTELFEFAGEAVEVVKELSVEVPEPSTTTSKVSTTGLRKGCGLFSMVSQLSKKNKLSVLEKTKLDWDTFKKDEGIAEELQTYNKGKDGYLEKQDFLQRSDLRQFEIEKAMRNSRRLK